MLQVNYACFHYFILFHFLFFYYYYYFLISLIADGPHHYHPEGFNDWGGREYEDFVPGEVIKQPLPGIRLHDPLHGRQACPKFIAFEQGVGLICPR